jgi:hypothetical protein
MDQLTRAFYELAFKVASLEKKGNEYQDFFSTIMEMRFPADFVRVRPWGNAGDRKNDGYLKSERKLFQLYAPNELTAAAAIAKIDEDFVDALPYWTEHFDTWIFTHNSVKGLGPDHLKKLLELDAKKPPAVAHWSPSDLRKVLFELAPADVAAVLGPAPSRRDMMDLGLETVIPVLDQVARMSASSDPDLRPPPADKIQRNMLSNSVATLLTAGMSRVDLVRKYFHMRPAVQDDIAETLQNRYAELRKEGRAPDDIFASLQRYVGGVQIAAPDRQSAVLAVLAYFFEECDIFDREQVDGEPS